VVLLPRPRRFGKTLNLSMLRCWFEKRDEDLSHLFEGLSIWQAGTNTARTSSGIRSSTSRSRTPSSIASRGLAAALARRSRCSSASTPTSSTASGSTSGSAGTSAPSSTAPPTPTLYERALLDLSAYLHAHHGEKVVILIDEYDEPIHAGHVHGYSAEILDFMRAFLGAGLKSNPHLFKAVMTGILRVAKENLFSGLNNLGVYTLLRRDFHLHFGFTEAEVAALLERSGRRTGSTTCAPGTTGISSAAR
jgi:hypothetical protein